MSNVPRIHGSDGASLTGAIDARNKWALAGQTAFRSATEKLDAGEFIKALARGALANAFYGKAGEYRAAAFCVGWCKALEQVIVKATGGDA
jgi:hypothetical protein